MTSNLFLDLQKLNLNNEEQLTIDISLCKLKSKNLLTLFTVDASA